MPPCRLPLLVFLATAAPVTACTPFIEDNVSADADDEAPSNTSTRDATGSILDATVDGEADRGLIDDADATTRDASIDGSDATTDSPQDGTGEANPDVGAEGSPWPLVWVDASAIDPSGGSNPAIAIGSGSIGPWIIQADEQPTTPSSTPGIQYQVASSVGAFGLPYPITSPAAQPAMAALNPFGGVLLVYACAAANSGRTCWFTGQLSPPSNQMVGWPYALSYGVGYRPRVAALVLDQGKTAFIVEVHMSTTGAALAYLTAYEVASTTGDATVVGGPNWGTPEMVYDDGPSMDPAVAISPPTSPTTAAVLEVHEDATNVLYYREGTLTFVSGAVPIVVWATAFPYPDRERGLHPAVAIYGSTVIEVHESPTGSLLSKVGTLVPGGVTWGPSVPYESSGANPALAVDPSTGSGVEVHQSTTVAGQVLDRAFFVAPAGAAEP